MSIPSRYRIASQQLIDSFLWVALAMCAIALAWLGIVGYQISSNASEFEKTELVRPTFDDYRKISRIDGLTKGPAPIEGMGLERAQQASLLDIFSWIGDFENGRSTERLRAIKPVVSGVAAGGLAEMVGIRVGDEITSVNGASVDSVYAVYEMLDQRSSQTSTVIVRRAGKLFSASMVAPAGQSVNAENSGLLFNVPAGLNLVFANYLRSLVSQFELRYVGRVPTEWRVSYQQGVAELAINLTPYVESQLSLTSADPGFISIDRMLAWYHEAFLDAIDRYSEQKREMSSRQVAALGGFGDAVLGLVSSLLLLLVAFLLRRSRMKDLEA